MALTRRWTLIVILLMLAAPALSLTVDQLIDSYDYGFYGGTVNVTTFIDTMKDLDSDGLNDTLVINLTTDANTSASYVFVVSLIDNQTLLTNSTNATVNLSSPSAQVSFDTRLLSVGRYNYTVQVLTPDYGLAFEKYKTQTQNYTTYRKGTSITSITDQNNGNNTLRVTVGLNVTKNETVNVTVYLSYGNNTIVGTKNVTLTSPAQNVTVDIDNETVKSTHYAGTYTIRVVQVGDKVFSRNQATASYNYEDFAKTSYVKNITSYTIDNDADNLTDTLRFNVTVVVKATDNYTVDLTVATSEDDAVATLGKNQSLSTGTQVVQLDWNGSDAYNTHFSGTFSASVVALAKNGTGMDTVANGYTTPSYSYADFEPPLRPDVTLTLRESVLEGTENVTLNVTNQGLAPAYNVVLDVFDNGTYEGQAAIPSLAVGQSSTVLFATPRTGNYFTAIADFDNSIDETNETNNVAGGYWRSLAVTLSDLSPGSTTKVIEATTMNNGTVQLDNVTSTLDPNGSTITNVTALLEGEALIVLTEQAYGSTSYTVRANATDNATNASATLAIGAGQPSLSVTLVSPSGAANVTSNLFTAFTAQVCCSGADCNGVNASLDPQEITTTYDYYSKKECTDGTCTTVLSSSPQFGYEDTTWKPIGVLRSFKGTIPIDCNVASDGVHLVDCVDYNATSRTLRVSVADGKAASVPIRVLQPVVAAGALTFVEDTKERQTLSFGAGEVKTITVPVGALDELHVGATSTNVTYVPTNATAFVGRWNITSNTLSAPNWTNCTNPSNYSAGDKTAISDGNSSTSIYAQGGSAATDYSYCEWMRWQINEAPSNITSISTWAYWAGDLNNGSTTITKAFYLGNATGQKWVKLDSQNTGAPVNHTGTVNSSITDYVENNGGNYYVYTLLHYNASKPGSTYAYSNFYDTQLIITSGNASGGGSNSSSSKGLVNTTTGATPFYTNGTNPRNMNLTAGMCQNVTWYVNATGASNTSYLFDSYANLTSNMSNSNKTGTINITIVAAGSNGSNTTYPLLLANNTFTSSTENYTLGSGWNWDSVNGWLTYNGSNFGGNLFSPNDSLTNYTNGYNITIVFTTGNITNTKLHFASSGSSLTGDKYNFERQNDTHQHFTHDSLTFPKTDNYADGTQQTMRISVNKTGNTTRACREGGTCSNTDGIGSTSFGDYLAIAPGTMNGKNTLNITTIEIWQTG
jgi:hypothetical protein